MTIDQTFDFYSQKNMVIVWLSHAQNVEKRSPYGSFIEMPKSLMGLLQRVETAKEIPTSRAMKRIGKEGWSTGGNGIQSITKGLKSLIVNIASRSIQSCLNFLVENVLFVGSLIKLLYKSIISTVVAIENARLKGWDTLTTRTCLNQSKRAKQNIDFFVRTATC